MKIPIYQRRIRFNAVYFDKIEIECQGTGIEEDPVIIEPSETLPESFYLENSISYIHIRNCTKSFISLNTCQNIVIEDCEIDTCHMYGCLNIKINNITVSSSLNLYETSFSFIENSKINYLELNQSSGNTIRTCTISRLRNKDSENLFEGNTIPEKDLSKLSKPKLLDFLYKWKLYYLIIFSIFLYSISVILIYFLPFDIPLPLVIIFFFTSIIFFYAPLLLKTVIERQKIRNTENNNSKKT